MAGAIKKLTGSVANLGLLLPTIVAGMQAWVSIRALSEGLTVGDKIKSYFGTHFSKIANENPTIHFFLIACIIVFMSSLIISIAHKMFGLKMHRSTRTYVLLSPFLCILCGLIYYGYINYQINKDYYHREYSKCATLYEIDVRMAKNNQTHEKFYVDAKREGKSYLHKIVKSSMSQVYYESALKHLSTDQVNELHKENVVWNGPEGREAKEIEISAYMLAAYEGNINFLRAANKSRKVRVADFVKDIEGQGKCEGYAQTAYGITYPVMQTLTPFKLAYDNNNMTCATVIEKKMQDLKIDSSGPNDYKGYFDHQKKYCKMGKGKNRTRLGDFARTIAAPFAHTKKWLFGYKK